MISKFVNLNALSWFLSPLIIFLTIVIVSIVPAATGLQLQQCCATCIHVYVRTRESTSFILCMCGIVPGYARGVLKWYILYVWAKL